MKKRLLSILLILSMILSLLPGTALAAAMPVEEDAPILPAEKLEESSEVEGPELNEELSDEPYHGPEVQPEADSESALYAIQRLVIDTTVDISVIAEAACTLQVAFYNDNGQMLYVRQIPVAGGVYEAFSVELPEDMPEYFCAKAFLMDSETFVPLCESRENALEPPQIECAELEEEHIGHGCRRRRLHLRERVCRQPDYCRGGGRRLAG